LLLVTHNPLIADLCDCVHTMEDGRIVATHSRTADLNTTVATY
jgi:ABC-type lipoprotein export system ATPase subunit